MYIISDEDIIKTIGET